LSSEARRARGAAAGVVVIAAAAAGVGGWAVGGGTDDAGGTRTAITTGTAAVVRTDVAQNRQFGGVLGYSGSFGLLAAGPGTVTRLPAAGTVVARGGTAYEVDGEPTVLLYGSRPAWRELAAGVPDGADVKQLEAGLKALGYGAGLTVDRHFSAATTRAVRRWQRAEHLPVTGTVPLGQVVFAPAAVRISGADVAVGQQVSPGAPVVHGTGVGQAVVAQIDPTALPGLKPGVPALVLTPDGESHHGRVVAVGAIAVQPTAGDQQGNGGDGGDGGNGGPPMIAVTIVTTPPLTGYLDQTEVQVAMAEQSHEGVLAVPITALRAQPGARYEVVVVDAAGGKRRVPVQTGLFDETSGVAEVSGPGLAPGTKVEVPRDGA
jgi:peptidoglycan hydrolase-like protein with peptidoglycan-binding domain